MRIRELLQLGERELEGAGLSTASIDVQLLLGTCLDKSRTEIYLAAEESVPSGVENRFLKLLKRRIEREPVAYLLGEREFWSLAFSVDRNVLIPRPETEFLLETVITRVRDEAWTPDYVLDLCCGSGVIATVLALEFDTQIIATDLSLPALQTAKKNGERHKVSERVVFINCDLMVPLSWQRKFSLIVSNPPYVKRADISTLEPEVRDYEPVLALDGGDDGLEVIRRIRASIENALVVGGYFFMEFGADQGDDVREIFTTVQSGQVGFASVDVFQDYSGRDRVLCVKK